jgi:hypothetical protein
MEITEILLERCKLEKNKKHLESQLASIKSKIKTTEEPILDYFQRIGGKGAAFKTGDMTLYLRREIWPGREEGVEADTACAALVAAGLDEFAQPRMNTQGLRAYAREFEEQGSDLLTEHPTLQGVIRVNEVFKVGNRRSE